MSEATIIPDGYVVNNVGGRNRAEPRFRVESGKRKPDPKADADALAVVVLIAIVLSVFILVYALVHYSVKGIEWCVRKLKARAAARTLHAAALPLEPAPKPAPKPAPTRSALERERAEQRWSEGLQD